MSSQLHLTKRFAEVMCPSTTPHVERYSKINCPHRPLGLWVSKLSQECAFREVLWSGFPVVLAISRLGATGPTLRGRALVRTARLQQWWWCKSLLPPTEDGGPTEKAQIGESHMMQQAFFFLRHKENVCPTPPYKYI